MKKICLAILLGLALFFIVYGFGYAQTVNTWYSVEKGEWKTVAWDAPVTLVDGDPLPDLADASLTYSLFIKNTNTQTIIKIGSGISTLLQEIALPKRGKYFVGVQADLLYVGETIPKSSIVTWSDNAVLCQGGQTFGLKFQTAPQGPKGLR